jgi:anti-sigma factor RsiW
MPNETCDHWNNLIIDRLADELSESDAILVEQHLSECRECAAKERTLRALVDSIRTVEEYGVDPAMEERLALAFRAHQGRGRPSDRTRRAPDRERRSLGFLPGLLLRPIPVYATLVLIVGACLSGAWLERGSGPAGPEIVARPHAEGGSLAERGDSSGSAQRAVGARISRFVVTPSDAVCLVGVLGADTL